jgi:zinc transport system permease protein
MNPERVNIIFMLLMAAVIAISMKIVGVLLITAMLIIPAATARRFSSGPEQMALLAAVIGAASVIGGLFGSLEWDTPAGPASWSQPCFCSSCHSFQSIRAGKPRPSEPVKSANEPQKGTRSMNEHVHAQWT